MRTENLKAINQIHRFPDSVDIGFLNGVLATVAFLCLFTTNPAEGVFALIQFKILLRAYWRKNIHPIALLLFLIPWIEISAGIIEANLRGITLDEMLHGTGGKAYWLSAFGLFAVQMGFYPFFKKSGAQTLDSLETAAQKFSLPRLIAAYFAVGPVTNLVGSFLGRGSSLYQFVTYLNEISLVILIVICLRQVVLKEFNRLFIAFLITTLFLSFYSFFSEWRTILFALFISFGIISILNTKAVLRILFFSFVFGNIIFLWQGIKPVYRAYLATGKAQALGNIGSQAVNVSRTEALSTFIELSQEFYAGTLEEPNLNISDDDGSDADLYSTLRRIGYLEFMALSLTKVPSEIPHEGGTLLQENLSFALIPRFLNPNKGVKDDGAKVSKYTGFMVAASASFSLGHYVEYYIDFGQLGMILALLLYGVLGGWLYQKAGKGGTYNPLFTLGVVYVVLAQWGSYQNDAIFVYGLTFFGGICHLFLFRPLYRTIEGFVQVS